MAIKILTGPLLNAARRNWNAIAEIAANSTTANTPYPTSAAIDGRSASRYQAGAVGNGYLRQTLEIGRNGGFEESAVNLTGWTLVGSWAITTTAPGEGTNSAELTGAGTAHQRWTVAPGATIQVRATAKGDATNAASITVEDERSGKFLQTDGTWTDTSVATIASQTAASWVTPVAITTTVEQCSEATVDLIVCLRGAAGVTRFDGVRCVPGVNLIVALGHNLGVRATSTASVSDLLAWSFANDDVASYSADETGAFSVPLGVPNAIKDFAATSKYYRSAELAWTCSQAYHSAHGLGEWILGEALSLRAPSPKARGYSLEYRDVSSTVSKTRSGARWVSGVAVRPARVTRLGVLLVGQTAAEEARDRLAISTRGGRDPICIVCSDVVADTVIYGYLADALAFEWSRSENIGQLLLTIEEEPLALW